MLIRAIFIRLDNELIQENVCACAKLFVDEENVLKSNRGRIKTLTDSTRKRHKKGGFSKLCVKIKERCYTDLLHFSTRIR